jgi:hypothetical protein
MTYKKEEEKENFSLKDIINEIDKMDDVETKSDNITGKVDNNDDYLSKEDEIEIDKKMEFSLKLAEKYSEQKEKQEAEAKEKEKQNHIKEKYDIVNCNPKVFLNDVNSLLSCYLECENVDAAFTKGLKTSFNVVHSDSYSEIVTLENKYFLAVHINGIFVKNESRFWKYCNLATYDGNYSQRLNEFLEIFTYGTEEEFIKSELDTIETEELSLEIFDGQTIEIKDYMPEFFSKNLSFLQKQKIDYLKAKLNQGDKHIIIESKNPEPRIFKNEYCYYLLKDYIDTVKEKFSPRSGILAHGSFLWHQMRQDGYIDLKANSSEFADFLDGFKLATEPLLKMKTKYSVDGKIGTYKLIKQKYKGNLPQKKSRPK